ncbi:MAG: pantoate--beta-alanine ligase, partial [Candidatus Krumholzibacteriia bacterium]
LQFGPGEDLERYPRDLEGDIRKLEAAGCDLLFAPGGAAMYRSASRTHVEVEGLGEVLCGARRPGHFRGVATVVAKVFHIVQPDVAVFGQKDAQQAILLQRMADDLDFGVELRFAPIVRDPDGLALSSRNAYLSPEERAEALLLHESLAAARELVASGERRAQAVRERVQCILARGSRVRVEYIELVETEALRPVQHFEGRVLLALAAHVGSTRLIDNIVLEVRGSEVVEVELESDRGRTRAAGRPT